ncbi:MAG: hypothetical protein LBL47_01945, partial [Lactobacillus sp.]|nr:hypothetical protein [Lactobacillus sp.]
MKKFLIFLLFMLALVPTEVFAVEGSGKIILDLQEDEEDTRKVTLVEQVAAVVEVAKFFEKNYPGDKIEEDLEEDLQKFFPNASKQNIFTLEKTVRNGIKIYRTVVDFIDDIKAKMIAPEPPTLIVDDDEYFVYEKRDYIESDDLVVINDFKKVLPYTSDPKERLAYEAKKKRENKGKPEGGFKKFLDMFSNVNLKKLPFYGVVYDSPITGRDGSGEWVEAKSVSARILTKRSTIDGAEQHKAAIQFKLPPNHSILLQDKDEFEALTIDLSGSENTSSFSVFSPAPVRNYDFNDEDVIGLGASFAVPFLVNVFYIADPVELVADIKASVCNPIGCHKVELKPQMVLYPGEGYLSAFSNLVEQAFTNLPSIDSKDIKLKKAVVNKGAEEGDAQSLKMVFKVSIKSSTFNVFINSADNIKFLPPITNLDGRTVTVTFKAKDPKANLTGKEFDVIATLDLKQSLQAKIYPVEASIFDSVSNNLSFSVMILAFIAGILANIMPCVFPFFISQMLPQSGRKERKYFVGVICGIIISAAMLASVPVIAAEKGLLIGYGMQLRNPLFLAAAMFAMLTFIIEMFGWFKFKISPLLLGMIMVLMAMIFGSPYMAKVLGFALAKSYVEIYVLGLITAMGLCLPWVLLAIWPYKFPQHTNNGLRNTLIFALCASFIWLMFVI